MANLQNIDMSEAKELGEGFRVLPPGEYQVYMESSEFKRTKKGTGEYLECVLAVADGEYEGAKVFVCLNLINPNQQAVDIAKSHLRALCEATVGQPFVNDSSMLHSRPFFALVDNVPMNKDDPNSKRSNEIVFRKGSIRPLSSGKSAAPAVVKAIEPMAQTDAAPKSDVPPWKQKK